MKLLPIYQKIKEKTKKIANDEGIYRQIDQSVDELNINIFNSEGINGFGIEVNVNNIPFKGQKTITTKITHQIEDWFPEKIMTDKKQKEEYLQKFKQYPRCYAEDIDGEIIRITCDQESKQPYQEDQLEPLIDHEIDTLYQKLEETVTKIENDIKKEQV